MENTTAFLITAKSSLESSLHTWRTLSSLISIIPCCRITSTYVENTVRISPTDVAQQGSPPHTWRTQTMIAVQTLPLRITSTYVENTYRKNHSFSASKGSPPHTWRTLSFIINFIVKLVDHLHIRGEHTKRSLIYQSSLIQIIAFFVILGIIN